MSSLLWNVRSGMLASIALIVIQLSFYPIYLSWLGLSQYGFWVALSSLISCYRIGDFGVGAAVGKFVAEARGEGDSKKVAAFSQLGLCLLFVFGGIVFLLLLSFSDFFLSWLSLSSSELFLAKKLFASVALLGWSSIVLDGFFAIVTGLGRISVCHRVQVIQKMTLGICSCLGLYLGWGLYSFVMGMGCAQLVSYGQLLPKVFPVVWKRSMWSTKLLRSLYTIGTPLFAGSVLIACLQPFHRIMLSRYASLDAVGVFDLAFRAAMQFRGVIEMGLRALMPEVSHLYAQGKTEEIKSVIYRSYRLIATWGVPCYLLGWLFSKPLISFWLQKSFGEYVYPAFVVMLLASLISLLGVPLYYMAMGMGESRVCFFEHLINGVGSMVIVALFVFFTGSLSAIMSCSAFVVSFSLSFLFIIFSLYNFFRN